jgi:hypothetical protein
MQNTQVEVSGSDERTQFIRLNPTYTRLVLPGSSSSISRQTVLKSPSRERHTGIRLHSLTGFHVRTIDEDLVNAIVVGTGKEAIKAVTLVLPLSISIARDVLESACLAAGINVGGIGAAGSDGIIRIDIDNLAWYDGVLLLLGTYLMELRKGASKLPKCGRP